MSLAFWGGLYGVLFGLIAPALRGPVWLYGIAMGIFAALVGAFVVAPLKGVTPSGNWPRSFFINGFWGLGLGLIYPLLVRPRD